MNRIKNQLLFFLLICFLPLTASAMELPNPLPAESIPEVINVAIRGILGVVGAVALLMFVWGGITWMTSQGNADKVRKGKDSIVWAIFGLVVIFSSYAVISFIFTALEKGAD